MQYNAFHTLMTCFFYIVCQEFITSEVLKLYGLTKDQSQKTDWQKMLKFGRKKRDRVDHILVGPKIKCLRVFFVLDFKGQQFHIRDYTSYTVVVCSPLVQDHYHVLFAFVLFS